MNETNKKHFFFSGTKNYKYSGIIFEIEFCNKHTQTQMQQCWSSGDSDGKNEMQQRDVIRHWTQCR